MVMPASNRIFAHEYSQLHMVSGAGHERLLVVEGPVVVGRLDGEDDVLLHVGPKANIVSFRLDKDLPVLKAGPDAYMLMSGDSAQFHVLTIPGVATDVLAAFEALLQQLTSYAVCEGGGGVADGCTESVEATSGNLFKTSPDTAARVRQAGGAVAWGVVKVGDSIGHGIVRLGEWYRASFAPADVATEVSESTQARLETAHKASKVVAGAASTIAGVVGDAVGGLAATATKQAKQAGLIPEGAEQSAAVRVGAASVMALVDVFDAMLTAAKGVVCRGAEETAVCVEYRYGQQAGRATREGFGVAQDGLDVYTAYQNLKTRALAQAFAANVVKAHRGAPGESGGSDKAA